MSSIRTRLISVLIGSTGLVWLLAVVWIYMSTQSELERVLDARLSEAAGMVNSLLTDHRIELGLANGSSSKPLEGFEEVQHSYERQLSCQIWSLDGRLVGSSEGAPKDRLTDAASGFSETRINGESWRVYTIENQELGVRVMVGDSIQIRKHLVGDVIKGLVLPAALILPFLVGVIWLSVRQGMSPLSEMADALSSRRANDLHPMPSTGLPKEIAPTVHALNGLFKRVQDARDRERSFTAYAAHELRTPLAGLKTQAQIALASSDAAVHANALRQITFGVDRTTRLVRQLLDLAALEASETEPELTVERPLELLRAVVAQLPPLAEGRRVLIEPNDFEKEPQARVEPHFFMLAVRNLVENALSHSPAEGEVTCRVLEGDGQLEIVIEDDGPGIPNDELSRVTDKFFRGRNKSATGSGLGLSIAQTACLRMGGSLHLQNREPKGLQAKITVPVTGA